MSIKENMKKISFDEAKNSISEYEYALVYMMSEFIFDRVDKISGINWDECMEAYCFGENGQLHFYKEDDEMSVTEFEDTEDLKVVERRYSMASAFKGIGKNIVIKEYLEADEDGQTYVAYKRLSGVE